MRPDKKPTATYALSVIPRPNKGPASSEGSGAVCRREDMDSDFDRVGNMECLPSVLPRLFHTALVS
jgi:hypothetical protein